MMIFLSNLAGIAFGFVIMIALLTIISLWVNATFGKGGR